MRLVLVIGHSDLRKFLRDRSSYIWLFVVPLLMMYFMGFAISGPGAPGNPRPSVLVENLDPNFLGRVFIDELGAQGLRVLGPAQRGEAQRGVRIPADFTERAQRGEQTKIQFFTVAGSSPDAAALVELRLWRALIGINARLVEQALRQTNAAPLTAEALRALPRPPDPVALDAGFAGYQPRPVGFGFSLPGTLVMYLLMNLLIFGGASLAWERQSGVLRRIAVQPLHRRTLLVGKLYGLMLLAGVQTTFLLLAGRFLLRVDIGAHLGAILVTLLVYSWVAASLGLLVGSVLRAEDKIVGVCVLASLVMAAVGGCWWPLEFLPEGWRVAAHLFPTGWGMDALHQLITFGGGLAQVGKPLGVLGLFGLAANAGAARFFRV